MAENFKSGILFYPIKKVLTNWTDRKNSLSKSSLQKIKDAFKVYYEYEKFNFLDSLFKVIFLSINYLRKNNAIFNIIFISNNNFFNL